MGGLHHGENAQGAHLLSWCVLQKELFQGAQQLEFRLPQGKGAIQGGVGNQQLSQCGKPTVNRSKQLMKQPVLSLHLQLNSEDLGEALSCERAAQMRLVADLQLPSSSVSWGKRSIQVHSGSDECWQISCSLALGQDISTTSHTLPYKTKPLLLAIRRICMEWKMRCKFSIPCHYSK